MVHDFGLVSVSLIATVSLAVLAQAASAQNAPRRQLEADIEAVTNQPAEAEVRVMGPNQQAWVLVPQSLARIEGGTSYPVDALPQGYPTGSTLMALINSFAESDAGEKTPRSGVTSF